MVPQDTYYINKFLDGPVPLSTGVPGDIDDGLTEMATLFMKMGTPLQNHGFVFNYKKSLNTRVADTVS